VRSHGRHAGRSAESKKISAIHSIKHWFPSMLLRLLPAG
jgi:hypothetical protein